MAQQKGIIDLRKVREVIPVEPTDASHALIPKTLKGATTVETPTPMSRLKPDMMPRAPVVTLASQSLPLPTAATRDTEWSVFEYEPKELEPRWYVLPVGIMIALAGFALFIKNYFFAMFIVIAFSALLLYRIRPPKKISFAVTKEGVSIGKTLYEFRRITSFHIFTKAGVKELSLETTHTLSPYVRVPLGDTSEEEVRQALRAVIPEKQHQEFMMDEFIRALGF